MARVSLALSNAAHDLYWPHENEPIIRIARIGCLRLLFQQFGGKLSTSGDEETMKI